MGSGEAEFSWQKLRACRVVNKPHPVMSNGDVGGSLRMGVELRIKRAWGGAPVERTGLEFRKEGGTGEFSGGKSSDWPDEGLGLTWRSEGPKPAAVLTESPGPSPKGS